MKKNVILNIAITALALTGCKSTTPNKSISQYTPNEYLVHIKDNVDPSMFNLGSIGESIKNGNGFTEIGNWGCGSGNPSKDRNKINNLWRNYCLSKGGIEYKRGACLNNSKEILFITSTHTSSWCETKNRFRTKIVLPIGNIDNEGFISKVKSYGYKTDEEIKIAAEELKIRKLAEINKFEIVLNRGKSNHASEVSSKVKGSMVCRNVRKYQHEFNEYFILKGFVEDNANEKIKVSIALISKARVSSNQSFPIDTSVNINGVTYTNGQEIWDSSVNWYLCS